jgi:O-antigen/teichoic acid export membrane protein
MGIARNAGYNLAGAAVSMLVSIVAVPFYIKAVGVERFGVLALCWLILGFTSFLNLGMGPAISQRLASLHSAPDDERADAFWSAVWLNVAIGAVAAVAVLLFAGGYFNSVAGPGSGFRDEMRDALPWLALMMPTVMVSSVMYGALQGRQYFLAMNMIDATSSVLMSLLPLAMAVLVSPRIDGLVAAALAGKLVALVLTYIVCVRAVPLRRPRRPVPLLMRQLVSFGGWVTLTSLLVPLIVSVDRFAIGAMIGAAAVSVYTIPFNLVSRMTILPISLSSALSPQFASVPGDHAIDLQVESAAALVTILTPLTILLLMVLGPFMHVWIGPTLADQSTPLGYIFVVGSWMNCIAYVPYAYLQARGRPDLPAKLNLAYLIPYVALVYAGLWAFGLVGAALAASLRSCFDPTLFAMAGTFRRIFPVVAPSALIVFAAVAAALALPWTSWPHWAALGGLLAVNILLSIRSLPAPLRLQMQRYRAMLGAGRQRRAAAGDP